MMGDLPFGFDKPHDSPGFLLWQTTTLWQRQIKDVLLPYALSHAQFVIMAVLMWFEARGYITNQALIVKQTKLDKMTVSKSITKLVSLGYIERSQHHKDTRAKITRLSQKGKDLLQTLVPLVEAADHAFFKELSKEEHIHFLTILNKVVLKN